MKAPVHPAAVGARVALAVCVLVVPRHRGLVFFVLLVVIAVSSRSLTGSRLRVRRQW